MMKWSTRPRRSDIRALLDIKKPPKGGFFMSTFLERVAYARRNFAIGLGKKLTGLSVIG